MSTDAAIAPAANPLFVLLDLVACPLLLFNAQAQVVFSNQTAKKMSCRPALVLGSDPNVRDLVRDIAAGQPLLHLEMQIDAMTDNGVVRLQCRCAPRPIAGLVAMVANEVAQPVGITLASEPCPVAERLSLQQIMELFRAELDPPIRQVLSHAPSAAPTALTESVQHLRERLERLTDLVNVFGDDVLIGDERMVVPEMVRNIAQDLAPLLQSMGVSFSIEGDREDLPPVYGSRRLIRRALFECLHNAVQHARDGVPAAQSVVVEIQFRAAGHHLLVHIHNIGVLSAALLTHHAATLFRPKPAQDGGSTLDLECLRIGLPLTQRILQLHGGRLRIEEDAAGELDVMLELPTGAPLRNAHHLDLLQAQIYAEDLSKLMARSRHRGTS